MRALLVREIMAKLDPSIFRAYDVRAIYPTELNEEAAARTAKALLEFVKARKIVLGRDVRTSSPSLHDAVVKAVLEQGADITDIGIVSTDCFYFACAHFDLPGIMITASHNPREYNGLKMVKKIPYLIGLGNGMEEIRDLAIKNQFQKSKYLGKLTKNDVTDKFVKKLYSFYGPFVPDGNYDPKKIRRLKVVVDASNGTAGKYCEKIFPELFFEVIPLHFEQDGTFPNHGANPLLPENRKDIESVVVRLKADVGFAFDSDVDRFFVIDDKGEFVPGDFVTVLLAKQMLKKYPKAKIVHDLRSSWAVADAVKKAKGTPLMNRVGHSYIKKRMADEGAVFGGEVAGHYYFKDFYNSDSGLVPAILILDLLYNSNKKMSQLHAELKKKYFISGEINTRVAQDTKPEVIYEAIKQKYEDGKVYFMDGISVEYKDWHFNLRPSANEPFVRLNLEARTRAKMRQKRTEVLKLIQKYT